MRCRLSAIHVAERWIALKEVECFACSLMMSYAPRVVLCHAASAVSDLPLQRQVRSNE